MEWPEVTVEDLLACDCPFATALAPPAFVDGPELDDGDEERARFIDRLEAVVRLGGRDGPSRP